MNRDADPPINAVLCEVLVEIPAVGVLVLEGESDVFFTYNPALPGETGGVLEYKLDEYTIGNSYLTTVEKNNLNGREYSDPFVRTHLTINTAGTKRYKLILYKKDVGPGNVVYEDHFIRGWYYPTWMNAQ